MWPLGVFGRVSSAVSESQDYAAVALMSRDVA